MKITIAQMTSTDDLSENLKKIKDILGQAKEAESDMVLLPENALYFRIHSDEPEALLRQDGTGGWVHLWQTVSAEHVYFSADEFMGEVHKEISVTLQNGRHVDFKVHQNETTIILWRVDEGIGYLFSNELGEQLLDFSDDNPI